MPNDGRKPSSASKKTEKELLHFGLDYLTLNICKEKDIESDSELFLGSIFALPHDTDNTNVVYDFPWGDFEIPFRIIYSDSPDGEIAQFNIREDYLFQVAKVDWEKPRWKNTRYRYRYRLQFYGALFNASRRGDLFYQPLFSVFLADIESKSVSHSVSRIDICADVTGYTPKKIKRGITGSHRKKMSILGEDPSTGEFQTLYYGDKKRDRNTWFARVYDKLADSRAKGKEKLYSDYFQFDSVTRIELEVHSDTIRLFNMNLFSVLDSKCLWGVLKGLLKTKYTSWSILPFLEAQRTRYDFASVFMPKDIRVPIPLDREQYAKRFLSMALRFEERYGQDPAVYLIKSDLTIKANALAYFYQTPYWE